MRKTPIGCINYTEDELLSMKKSEATSGLTEQQQRFCECYIEGHNKKIALIKAGYSHKNETYVTRLLHKEEIQRYIAWIRIAFADISDFVDIYPYSIKLKPADQIDGQLVKSIKSGRDGVSIELHDKMKALDCLSRYVEDMPLDFKQKIEQRRTELLEQEFELKKKAQERSIPEQEDDGFLQAIKESVESIWETDEKVLDS